MMIIKEYTGLNTTNCNMPCLTWRNVSGTDIYESYEKKKEEENNDDNDKERFIN